MTTDVNDLSLIKESVESIANDNQDQYETELIGNFLLAAKKRPYKFAIASNMMCGGGGGGGGGCGGGGGGFI